MNIIYSLVTTHTGYRMAIIIFLLYRESTYKDKPHLCTVSTKINTGDGRDLDSHIFSVLNISFIQTQRTSTTLYKRVY
jgi:hypothetical protein